MLQVGRSRDQFPIRSFDFRNFLILPASNINENQKMFLASVSRLPRQCRILNISQLYRPPQPVTGIALLYGDEVCFL
jgi:hypothetical protein